MPDSSADRHSPMPPAATEAMHPAPSLDTAAELVRVLDQYMADLKSGAAPDRARLLAEHPALAAQLEPCLAGIEFISQAARPTSSPSQLGDFRIVREVGRGGMGVVYEAEQISLRRRVALKVLRFGAVADKEAVERFRREAETVAHLHHTNIVPIFAVGSEQGVSYYAMQYIEGGSLADVIGQKAAEQDSNPPTKPRSHDEFARWGLESAEALAHAHQRGVIHRDIKPSNLLLDTDGRVWLTDFGLARRMDEVTMTISGMLMGTPRYMSPEQATSVKQPVDHRTDIYSLGATLYELVTGQPVFASDTPHGVISQILTAEPVRPRNIRRAIPCDLETIILKCLAKEPAQRYSTAQALADDLRAFRENRAIKARRAGLPERAIRWIKQRKKSIRVAATAAAATLLLAAGLFAGLSSLASSRLAHLSVSTKGPPLKVEVLDEDERTAVATFTAPTQQAQTIPPGHYHVRLSTDGQLSETSLFDADKGSSHDLNVALAQRNLWEIPVQDGEADEVARIENHDDVLLAATNQVRRFDGATGKPVWQTILASGAQPLVAKVLPTGESNATVFGPRFNGPNWFVPSLVRPLVDLDGDGVPDLIWASRVTASLIAISGKSGKVLWCHRSRTTLPEGLKETDIQTHFSSLTNELVVGQPLMAEVDGRKIVVAMCFVEGEIYFTKSQKWIRPPPQLWLDAVDAQTGETVWRRSLESQPETPERTIFAAAVGSLHGRKIGTIANGNRLFGFDFSTGEPLWPDRQLGAEPPIVVRFADLLGDSQLNVLLLRAGKTNNADGRLRGLSLVALSPLSEEPLWEKPLPDLAAPATQYQGSEPPQFDWPLVVDLDGTGKLQVALPFVDLSAGVCGLEVVEGATGKTFWRRALSSATNNWRPPAPDRIIAGPDLDGDGYHELFAVSFDEQSHQIYVDALSGRDGRSLWTYTRPTKASGLDFGAIVAPLRWWQTGADGWPLLVVSGQPSQVGLDKPWSLVLSASSGRVEHVLDDFGVPETADFNGDGLPDLFARRADSAVPWGNNHAGKLLAIKGAPPEAWRMLSNQAFALAGDLNGDGCEDLVHFDNQHVRATSGRDGSLLWSSDQTGFTFTLANSLQRLQAGDLDGDGIPDFLMINNSGPRLNALSGRDGKLLWSVDLKFTATEPMEAGYPNGVDVHLACHVMEPGQSPDVLLLYSTMGHGKNGHQLQQLWLARVAGRDGEVRWRQPLSEPNDLNVIGARIPLALADLNGDGVNDIVFWLPLSQAEARANASTEPGATASEKGAAARSDQNSPPTLAPHYELCAVNGRDGKLLWSRPGFYMQLNDPQWSIIFARSIPQPAIAEFDGDGQPVVLITDARLGPNGSYDETSYAEVVALGGTNGKTKWSWRGDSGYQMGFWQDAWEKGSPRPVRTAAGKRVVVSINDRKLTMIVDPNTKFQNPSGKSGQQIVVLDSRGQVVRRTDVASPGLDGDRAKIWTGDLNGDGLDEVVCVDAGHVRAIRPSDESWLWSWPSLGEKTTVHPADVVQILPAGKTYPATVAVTTAASAAPSYQANGVYGLAGPTGKMRWRFDTVEAFALLTTNDPAGMPRIFTLGPGAERNCGISLPINEAGLYLPQTLQAARHVERLADPWFVRPLPRNLRAPGGIGPFVNPLETALPGALICIVMIGLVIGKRPGKWRRAAWLIGLWLIVWLLATAMLVFADAGNNHATQEYAWIREQSVLFGMNIATLLLLAGLSIRWLLRFMHWSVRR